MILQIHVVRGENHETNREKENVSQVLHLNRPFIVWYLGLGLLLGIAVLMDRRGESQHQPFSLPFERQPQQPAEPVDHHETSF